MAERNEENERRTRRLDNEPDDVEGHRLRKGLDNETDDVEGHRLRKA